MRCMLEGNCCLYQAWKGGNELALILILMLFNEIACWFVLGKCLEIVSGCGNRTSWIKLQKFWRTSIRMCLRSCLAIIGKCYDNKRRQNIKAVTFNIWNLQCILPNHKLIMNNIKWNSGCTAVPAWYFTTLLLRKNEKIACCSGIA